MKRKLIISIIVALVALTGIGGYIALTQDNDEPADTSAQQTAQKSDTTVGSIRFSQDGKTVSYTGEVGKTALVNLQKLTSVNVQGSEYGDMVVGINGVKADDGKNYWSFYVNDAYANESAGTYVTKTGDTFSWKLEAIK